MYSDGDKENSGMSAVSTVDWPEVLALQMSRPMKNI